MNGRLALGTSPGFIYAVHLILLKTLKPLALGAVFATVTMAQPSVAREIPVGVNVNSLQNFSAADQQVIVEQLKRSGVRFVRTSLRPDDKNMNLAKELQAEGIRLVLVMGPVYAANAQARHADEIRHMRSAMPLSAADPERSRAYYQTVFDRLDEKGVVLAGVEVGNELNWCDFNGDFPIPGEGKAFSLEDLSRDPEAKKVAQGLLQYLKVVAALKEVRDHSKLNRHAPIISAGMAAAANTKWLRDMKVDGVSIPAAIPRRPDPIYWPRRPRAWPGLTRRRLCVEQV
jgi:hypothetical protein